MTEPRILANNSTFFEELTAAARGVVALVLGDRKAADYFDFSDRGLIGSFIAFCAGVTLYAAVERVLGPDSEGAIFRGVAANAIVFVLAIGCSAFVLRQLRRLDGLVPYLVASNWSSAVVMTAVSIAILAGVPAMPVVLIVALLAFVIEINIARLIVTLSTWQIVIFLIAQLFGQSIALITVGILFPMPDAAISSPPM